MGCFIVPATEAVITTIATKAVKAKEEKCKVENVHLEGTGSETPAKVSFSEKMKWLNNMLWGGSALLAFEHVWHGEVIASFPFLSAAANPADAAAMLREMATTGVAMSVLVTGIWMGMVAFSSVIEKKAAKTQDLTDGGV